MEKDNKNLNIFWKSLTVSIVTGLVILCVTYLLFDYPNSSGSNVVNISFIKDTYSIIFSIFAPFIAIYLFNDWKDQHNKSFHSERVLELIKLLKKLNKDIQLINITIDYIKKYQKEESDLKEKIYFKYIANKISHPNRDDKENYDPDLDKRLQFVINENIKYITQVKGEFNKILELNYEIILELGCYICYSTDKKSEIIEDIYKIYNGIDSIHTKFRNDIFTATDSPQMIIKFKEIQEQYSDIQIEVLKVIYKLYKVTKA